MKGIWMNYFIDTVQVNRNNFVIPVSNIAWKNGENDVQENEKLKSF